MCPPPRGKSFPVSRSCCPTPPSSSVCAPGLGAPRLPRFPVPPGPSALGACTVPGRLPTVQTHPTATPQPADATKPPPLSPRGPEAQVPGPSRLPWSRGRAGTPGLAPSSQPSPFGLHEACFLGAMPPATAPSARDLPELPSPSPSTRQTRAPMRSACSPQTPVTGIAQVSQLPSRGQAQGTLTSV